MPLVILEAEGNAASNIERIQIVGVTLYPAAAPERIAPVSTVARRREISWRVSELAPQSKVVTHVVPCASTHPKGKTRRTLDSASVC